MARNHPPGPDRRSLTADDRDAALARVGRMRRWLLGAAAALVAGLAALASALVPGRSLAANGHQTPTSGAGTATSRDNKAEPPLPPPASTARLGLRAPDEAPQPSPQPQSDPAPQAAPAPQSDPSQQSAPAQPSTPAPQPQDNT